MALSDGLSKPPKSETIACTEARHEMDVASSPFAVVALSNIRSTDQIFDRIDHDAGAYGNEQYVGGHANITVTRGRHTQGQDH